MNILILEDSTSRINYFIEKFSGHNLIITENAEEAIIYLEDCVFDLIFLDHDLGPDNGCGADVVAYLVGDISNENNDAIIIVHSWNVPAVNAMISVLPTLKFFPFGSEKFLKIGDE